MVENEQRALANQVVMPLVTPEQAKAQWKIYEATKAAILVESDYQTIQGKKFPKKSAFRKLAVFFGLNDEITGEERVDRDDGSFTWGYTVKVTAPNGRTTTNIGLCDSREKRFAHVEHDVKSTAHTRAKSRAISDMVAGGEGSAEEVEAEEPQPRKKVDAEAKPVEKPNPEKPAPEKAKPDDEEIRVTAVLEANNLPFKDLMIWRYNKVVRVVPQEGFPQEMFLEYDKILKLLRAKWLALEDRGGVPGQG